VVPTTPASPPTPAQPPPDPPLAEEGRPKEKVGPPIGVAECDAYLARMARCTGSLDADAAATMKTTLGQIRDAWRAAAEAEASREALRTGCKAALDSIPPHCR
jgi:hypothetical protein